MTLEDFFTLTEMKDGLTALARVNELVTVMQKEKDYVVKNVGEATRQWSTVASTIAATENKECLDLFIQLDGLWFIDRWLNDAQKFGNDSGNSFVDESITALLRALERLQIDNQTSVPSGIWMTVKNLIDHSSSAIQDKAKALFESWKLVQDHDAAPQDVKQIEALHDDGIDTSADIAGDNERPECSSLDISPSGRNDNEENNVEPSKDETLPSVFSDAIQQVRVDKEETQTPDKTVNNATMNQGPLINVDSSSILNNVGENLAVKEKTPIYNSEGTAVTETCGSVPTMQGKFEVKLDVSQLGKCADDAKEMQQIVSLEKGAMEISSSISSPLEKRAPSSSADVENTLESASEPDLKEDTDAKDEDSCPKLSPVRELRKVVSPGRNRVDDGASLNPCRSTLAFETRDEDVGCNAAALRDSSGDEHKWGEDENPKTSASRIDNDGVVDGAKEHAGNESKDDSNFFKPSLDAKSCGLMSNRSDMELDYGMVDPLDIARQVAIEVKREVDCREQSCSTSEKTSGGGIRQPNSPDSTNGKEGPTMEGPGKEGSTGPKFSSKALLIGMDPAIHAETHGAEQESCVYDTAASQISEAAQASEANTGKGFSGFDLNQEVCSEDAADRPTNSISTPISVVSASRAAAAAGLPNAPLQFEGTLGWKGSAATSAFRRIPDGDKTLSLSGGPRNNLKQRLDFLDFDLNVAEGGEDNKIEDLLSGKQIPITSGLPSGEESSVEASPRRSERLQLDLNRVSDGAGDIIIDWRREGRSLLNQNGLQSPSRSSSSSSMQPSLRNIDLNNQPIFLHDSSSDHPYLGKSFHNLNAASGSVYRQEESVISILGTRVEIKRKDSVPQNLPLPNGRISEPAMDISWARSGGMLGIGSSSIPFAHSPLYGYTSGYAAAALPFSSPMYGTSGGPGPGPIPYMVDSRGAPVVPQIMGSSSSALPSAFSQPPPPLIMNMTAGTSSGSYGAGPSRHNFDLNSGLMMDGGGSRETSTSGGLRQFFNHSQEHLRANAQPPSSSSVLGLKRQEPDSGWEPYPINFKHQQPPWK